MTSFSLKKNRLLTAILCVKPTLELRLLQLHCIRRLHKIFRLLGIIAPWPRHRHALENTLQLKYLSKSSNSNNFNARPGQNRLEPQAVAFYLRDEAPAGVER